LKVAVYVTVSGAPPHCIPVISDGDTVTLTLVTWNVPDPDPDPEFVEPVPEFVEPVVCVGVEFPVEVVPGVPSCVVDPVRV
jgi:hypothetical protein